MFYTLKKYSHKILWTLKGGYKPKEFWDNWSETFMDDPWQVEVHPQHEWLLKKLDYKSKETILEVGCGFGRNIKYLVEKGISQKKITGVDISPEMIKKAKNYLDTTKIILKTASILDLPFSNNSFDIVFTHGVLMHVTPKNVKDAIVELSRVSSNKLLLIEQNYGGNEYTFTHDYKKLLKSLKLNIVEYKVSKKLGLDLIYVEVR